MSKSQTSSHAAVDAQAVDVRAIDAQVLAEASTGKVFEIVDVTAPADAPDWAMRLQEIGFIVGERVTVLRRSMPGGDPIAIRVSDSTFALRRAEAACIRVRPIAGGAA